MICWIPLAINLISKSLFHSDETSGLSKLDFAEMFCYCAVHYNSAIDPLIYAYRIKDVGDAVRRTLRIKHQPGREIVSFDMSSTSRKVHENILH